MSKPNYEPQEAIKELLYEDEKLEKEIARALERVKKEREKKTQPKVTRLVDRKGDDILDESYHDQMHELARQEIQEREGYFPDDVEHV